MTKIKKFLTAIALTCIIACFGTMFTACGNPSPSPAPNPDSNPDTPDPKPVTVQSIEFDKDTVTLDSGSNTELTYTVTPTDGKIAFKVLTEDKTKDLSEKVFTYTITDGKVKIQAVYAGVAVLRAYAETNSDVYADCTVTVNPPEGYSVYKNTSVKFVYPSDWTKSSQAGVVVMFSKAGGSTNANLTRSAKDTTIFSATAQTFIKTIEDTYKAMGYTVSDIECTVEKYDNNNALRVDLSYSLMGITISQVQLVRNSSSNSYVLTVTNATDEQIEVMQNEFFAW